jgi:urease accessory protein
MIKSFKPMVPVLFTGLALGSRAALAHPGHEHATLQSGLAHPLMGLDHVLAMVAVGLWAFQLGGRAIWALPLTFVGVMGLGGVLGAGSAEVSWAEHGILASIAVLGLAIAAAKKIPTSVGMLVVSAFALCHGMAHGHEMGNGSFAAFATGFMTSTAMLHVAGIVLGYSIHRLASTQLVRVAGGAIAAASVLVLVQ